jgi:hypothetical protein
MGIPFKYTPPKFYVLPSRPDLSEANADLRERPTQIDEILAYGYTFVNTFQKIEDPGLVDLIGVFIYQEAGRYSLGLLHYGFPKQCPDYEEYTAESDWTILTKKALESFKQDLITQGIHYKLVEADQADFGDSRRILISPATASWVVHEKKQKNRWTILSPWESAFSVTPHAPCKKVYYFKKDPDGSE